MRTEVSRRPRPGGCFRSWRKTRSRWSRWLRWIWRVHSRVSESAAAVALDIRSRYFGLQLKTRSADQAGSPAESPLVPTPFDPATLALTPLPKFILLIGIAPAEMEPTCCDPPQAEVDSTTVNGRPLFAE